MTFLFFVALIGLSIHAFKLRNKLKQSIQNFRDLEKRFNSHQESTDKQIKSYKGRLEQLSKYQHIVDVQREANRIKEEAEKNLLEARESCREKVKKTKERAREIRERADRELSDAHEIASQIEQAARARAEEIAGAALKAKENAEAYEATEKAMRNLIQGYGDEYLSPNRPIIEDLIEEYDFKEAGQKLAQTKALIKSLLQNEQAADCSYVEDYRRKTAIEFVLDAFNGKIDSIMSKVKPHNYDKLEEQILDAYHIVNHNGKAFRDAHITKAYLDANIEQLKWATIVQRIKQEDREEQRRIKEQIREEERARREYEKARKQAEREERLIQKTIKQVEDKLSVAAEEERSQYEAEIAQLRADLDSAYERGERAISMAQKTKQGHVYIISNIGSFGEEVFKVGLTRRLEPMDRVKELGDASVPFEFDVHAMVFSEDAPALEKAIHDYLEAHRINKVNPRKEFFKVSLASIKQIVEESGYSVHWTLRAEAAEYRESLRLEKQNFAAASTTK